MLTPQGQCENGHIVDRPGLDERLRCPLWHAVRVGVELAVDLDQGIFLRGSDQEAHDDEALARAGNGVDILDSRNFMHQVFDRVCDALLDLLGRRAGHGCHHVQHRHQDLRLLLTRDHRHGKQAQRQRSGDGERREL